MSSWLGVAIAQITYDKHNQGITNLLNYTIPWNTEIFRFSSNLIELVPGAYFQNVSSLDLIVLKVQDAI